MKRARFSDEQIVRILRETDMDTVVEVAKRHGVSEPTIYAWRKKFGDLENDEVRCLKTLEAENIRLRKLLVDRDLEIEVMKEINRKSGERAGASGTGPLRDWSWGGSTTCLHADSSGSIRAILRTQDAKSRLARN